MINDFYRLFNGLFLVLFLFLKFLTICGHKAIILYFCINLLFIITIIYYYQRYLLLLTIIIYFDQFL